MTFPNPQILEFPDVNLAVYEAGPKDGPAILLVHGWPECAYSWKTQIEPLTAAGFRVIAYDVRGFGRSSVPAKISDYGIEHLVSDVEKILDALALKTVIICGHDWGGIITWHAARMLECRISHVISVCTPHVKRAPANPIDIFRQRHGDEHYFVKFADNESVHELFETDIDAFFRMMFKKPNLEQKPTSRMYHIPHLYQEFLKSGAPHSDTELLDDSERSRYVQDYERSGFFGGVNLYRNTPDNWAFGEGLDEKVRQPCLMISARHDLYLPPETTAQMTDLCPDLERYIIEDCGHWVMWERPDDLSVIMLDWLKRRV